MLGELANKLPEEYEVNNANNPCKRAAIYTGKHIHTNSPAHGIIFMRRMSESFLNTTINNAVTYKNN